MKKYLIWTLILCVSSIWFLFAYDQELIGAYEYAFDVSITTMPTIDQANMNGKLIRSHMAKMMSNYATEVLHLVPNTGKVCLFDDISWQTEELKWFITKSCQLGLMWVGISDFDPEGDVTRAQFGTVLSRAIYGEIHNDWIPYYINHLLALNADWIMNNISQPSNLEIRWYVMLMMQRADALINGSGDLISPTASIVYSMTGSTTGSTTATLTWRSEDITGVSTYTHVFTENGSFIFYFQDIAWNAGSVTATVTNIIDIVNPTANVKYSTTWATNGDVIAHLTGRSETITWANTYTHTFTWNGSFIFTFSDLAGNTGNVTATVANIDRTAPVWTITYSPTTWSYVSWNIIATLTSTEGITITNNSWANTYTFSWTGQNFTFNFVDAAGNTGSKLATTTDY